jgi:hypothetical protein
MWLRKWDPARENVGKKLLGGLFDTGKGIATLDAKQVEKGIVGSTVGTIDLSLDAVGGAGSAAGGGLGQSVSDLTGSAAVQGLGQGHSDTLPNCHATGRKGPGENALSASNPMKQKSARHRAGPPGQDSLHRFERGH